MFAMPDVDISVLKVETMTMLKDLRTTRVEFAGFDLSTHEVTGGQISRMIDPREIRN
jgi:hypothetical protein